MKITIECEPGEIAFLLGNIRDIISNDLSVDLLDLRASTEVKHFIDTKAINELIQLTHPKRREETL